MGLPPSVVSISKLLREHIEEIIAMLRSLNERWDTDRFDSAENLAKYLGAYQKRGFVARTEQGELAGFVLYCMGYVWPLDRKEFHPTADTRFISDIIVHPRHWRKGIGTQLMIEAEKELTKMGARRITLYTGPDNARAQAFFAGIGYRVSGRADSVGFEKVVPRENSESP